MITDSTDATYAEQQDKKSAKVCGIAQEVVNMTCAFNAYQIQEIRSITKLIIYTNDIRKFILNFQI